MKNISLKNLESEFKKLTHSKGVDTLKMEITPYRDWRTIVTIFFIGLTTVFAFNVYMIIEINRENFFSTDPKSSSGAKFNEGGLGKVVQGLDEKAAVFEKARTEGVWMVDPSL